MAQVATRWGRHANELRTFAALLMPNISSATTANQFSTSPKPRVFLIYTSLQTMDFNLKRKNVMATEQHIHSAVFMITVEICPDIALAFINTIIFSLIMYSKCVRSN